MSLKDDGVSDSPVPSGGQGNLDSDNENTSDNDAMDDTSHRSVSPDSDQEGQSNDNFPSMAAILFGNIDSDGKLTDNDFLDSESKEKLSGLSTLLGKDNEADLFEASDTVEQSNVTDDVSFVAGQKSEDAQDFSNIDDAMTDDSSSNDEESDEEKEADEASENNKSNIQSDTEATSKDKIPSEGNHNTLSKNEAKIDLTFKQESNLDSELMPPPPGPLIPSKTISPKASDENKEKRSKPKTGPVIKPLASMMPEKYRGVDVKTLFPEFRENQVLRFSRLFPVKQENMPKIWKNVKRRLMKSEGESEEPKPKIKRPYTYENSFAPAPDPILHPEAYCEDQAVRFHSTKKVG